MKAYDYIVVGAGSAGGALAARLAKADGVRVLLIEAGGKADHWSVRMPLGYYINYAGGPFNWAYSSTPQNGLKGREIYQPRGKGLGGSSAINGMAFLRGNARDYDRWESEGATGWSFQDVLPYFKRLETCERGASALRGGAGPVTISRQKDPSPICDAFIQAGLEAGFAATDDFNGAQQEGFGYFDQNIEKGRRASTSHAYLRSAVRPKRLDIRTDAQVLRLIQEGNRISGVHIAGPNGLEDVRCEGEVILSAGAFGSPQILMLSGIGPAEELRRHGIDVAQELPGVGGNLQDHLEVHISWHGPVRHSLNRYAGPIARTIAGAQWLLSKSGVCATNGVPAGAFTKSHEDILHPDLQYHFFPFFMEGLDLPPGEGGFCVCVGPLRAKSRGRLSLASSNPTDAPLIDFQYLSDPQDLDDMVASIQQARDIAEQPALAPFRDHRGEQDSWAWAKTDDALKDLVRERAESAYHPCGTCKMGTDQDAVVDPTLRVHGVEGLRVADASVMPSITSGNLNAPSIMIGERAADLVLGLH